MIVLAFIVLSPYLFYFLSQSLQLLQQLQLQSHVLVVSLIPLPLGVLLFAYSNPSTTVMCHHSYLHHLLLSESESSFLRATAFRDFFGLIYLGSTLFGLMPRLNV